MNGLREAGIISEVKLKKYRWIIYFLLSFSFLIAFFHRYAIGVVSNLLAGDLNLTATQLGMLSSLYFYAYGILQVPVGIGTDKFGVRKLTTGGMISIGLGSLIFALARGALTIYAGRLLIGIGSAVFFISTIKTISVWFPPEEYTKMLGWTSLIGNLGALLAAAPFSLLLSLLDWRSSYFLFAGISALMAFFIWYYVRDNPRQLGLEPEYDVGEEKRSLKRIIIDMKKIIKSSQFWQYFFIAMVILGSFMSLSGMWLVPYLTHVYEFSRNFAAALVMVITVGMLIGSAFLGRVEDRMESRVRMIRTAVIINILAWIYIVIIEQGNPSFLILMIILFILGGVGVFPMTSFANIKKMFPRLKGSATGLMNISPFLGTIIFNTLIGWRLDATWQKEFIEDSRLYTLQGYRQGFIIILIFLILALAASLRLKKIK